MKKTATTIYNTICECGKTIPLTEVLVGIVVPIVAAWVSFFLADRALRKKENNKLYIQIELIRRELKNNNEQLCSFIDSFMRKKELDKALEFPLMFMKSFLIEMLDELQVIKESYMRSGSYLFERPTKLLLLGEQKEKLDSEISKLRYQGYSDQNLDEKRKLELFQKMKEREKLLEEPKKYDRDIYSDFQSLQKSLERKMVGDVFQKKESEEENFILAKYIYEKIKEFNEITDKDIDDVLSLYKELVIFEIDSDIVKDSHFEQEEFDLFYKAFENSDGMEQKLYNLCELYYKRKAMKNFLLNHDFEFQNNRWNENSADFVVINDRNLYISLVELYEKLACSDEVADGEDYEEKYQYSIECHEEITKILNVLEQHEKEVKKKCK